MVYDIKQANLCMVLLKATSLQYNRVRDLIRRVHQVHPEMAFFTGTVFNFKWFLDEGGAGVIDPVFLFEPSTASRLIVRYREAEHATRRRARECIQEVNNLQDYLDSWLNRGKKSNHAGSILDNPDDNEIPM